MRPPRRGAPRRFLNRYREPWTQKQDAVRRYFLRWLDWAAPIVAVDAAEFPFRYPTAGASEGIFKIIADISPRAHAGRLEPTVHIFEGECM